MFCTMLLNNCYGAAITLCHRMALSAMEPAALRHPWWTPPLYFSLLILHLFRCSSSLLFSSLFSLLFSVWLFLFFICSMFYVLFSQKFQNLVLFFRISEFSSLFIRISEFSFLFINMFYDFFIKPIMMFPILTHIQDNPKSSSSRLVIFSWILVYDSIVFYAIFNLFLLLFLVDFHL